jgi:glutathionyl-hydroquinone reductase
VRRAAAFRGWADIESGPGRYHLYVAPACPWSHRTMIVRRLKGLDDALSMSLAHPYRDERGWRLLGDDVNGFEFLREAYEAARPGYDDRISVPVLWDREEQTIVNNESTDIVRMLDDWGDATVDLYPEELRAEIDELDDWVYGGFQNSVYRAGFSRSRTGGCSPRSSASTPSTTCTSAATAAASPTARTCGATRASCTSSRASPRR